MLRIAVDNVSDGLHPSEVVVTILTSDGSQEVAVDRSLVVDRRMKAYAVKAEDNNVLVELPRETASGSWRVWVARENVFADGASG